MNPTAPLNGTAITDHVTLLCGRAKGLDGVLVVFAIDEGEKPIVRHFRPDDPSTIVGAIADHAQEPGRNVYLATSLFRPDLEPGKKGGEADVIAVLGLVADFDHLPAGENCVGRLPLPPDLLLETSPGRYQAFYLPESPLEPEAAKELARGLAGVDGCDPTSADISHVWRIPGTLNWPTAKKIAQGRALEPAAVRVLTPLGGASSSSVDALQRAFPGPLSTPQEVAPAPDIPPTPTDVTALLDRLPKWLRDELNKIGDDRSEHLYHVVGSLVGQGLSNDEIVSVLRAHTDGAGNKYKDRGDDDLLKEVARCRARVDEGRALAARPRRRFNFIPMSELLDRPPQRFLIEDLIPEKAFVVMFGREASGKSFVAQDILIHLARGEPCFGRNALQGTGVLVAGEGTGGIPKRILGWQKWHGQKVPKHHPLVVEDAVDVLDKEAVEDLIFDLKTVADRTGSIRLVVLDTYARCMSGDENATKDASAAVQAVQRIINETNASVLLIHHRGKDSTRGLRGSTVINGAADTIIRVDKKGDTVTLHCEKNKDGPEFQPIRLRLEPVKIGPSESTAVLVPAGEASVTAANDNPPPTKRTRAQEAVVDFLLATKDEPLPAGRIKAALADSFAPRTVERALTALVEVGRLKNQNGAYTIKNRIDLKNIKPTF